MNQTQKSILLLTFLAILTLAFLTVASGGCAGMAPPCHPASVVMAKRGRVLECRHAKMRDTGDAVDVCVIEKPDGTLVEKIVFPRHCGL